MRCFAADGGRNRCGPWTIRVALALHSEPNFQFIEYECDRDVRGVYRHPPPQFLK